MGECAVCLEAVCAPTRTLGCGHAFHAACVDKWLRDEGQRSCPVCRFAVPLDQSPSPLPSVPSPTERADAAAPLELGLFVEADAERERGRLSAVFVGEMMLVFLLMLGPRPDVYAFAALGIVAALSPPAPFAVALALTALVFVQNTLTTALLLTYRAAGSDVVSGAALALYEATALWMLGRGMPPARRRLLLLRNRLPMP